MGIPVYDADMRARDLMLTDPIRKQVEEAFGKDAYQGGKLNRQYLAGIVFRDAAQLSRLNAIVHPAIREDFRSWRNSQKAPYVIHEAAILFESGNSADCDSVISITSPEEVRIERVVRRDGLSESQVLDRIRNQWTDEKRNALSDYIINNDGRADLNEEVMKIHRKLLESVKSGV